MSRIDQLFAALVPFDLRPEDGVVSGATLLPALSIAGHLSQIGRFVLTMYRDRPEAR